MQKRKKREMQIPHLVEKEEQQMEVYKMCFDLSGNTKCDIRGNFLEYLRQAQLAGQSPGAKKKGLSVIV